VAVYITKFIEKIKYNCNINKIQEKKDLGGGLLMTQARTSSNEVLVHAAPTAYHQIRACYKN
jgi:hypothetical protein